MEASAVHPPLSRSRRKVGGPLLRLRSDEQLIAAFRGGSEEAFTVIHDRYRQRLFAYCRQMLNGPRQDAEDVLQDVFVRAYSALRNDERTINLRAWLYRVAHNRCIDHLRRPTPPEQDIFEMSRTPLHDPIIEAQRRDDLQKLVQDVGNLPDQQRSALLMREIDGISYQDLAAALDVTVPAVKSLLVRARMGLAEAAEARDMDCSIIREDLTSAFDRGVRASGRARRHMRECCACREYKGALRSTKAQFAAIAGPAALFAPLALLTKIGIGSGSGAAGAGAAAAGGGGVAALAGTASAGKVAAVVASVALATGGAVEVKRYADHHQSTPRTSTSERSDSQRGDGPRGAQATQSAPAAVGAPSTQREGAAPTTTRGERRERALARRERERTSRRERGGSTDGERSPIAPPTEESPTPVTPLPGTAPGTTPGVRGGDAESPAVDPTTGGSPAPGTTPDAPGTDAPGTGTQPTPPGTAPPGSPPPSGSTSSVPPPSGTTP